ncbi:MAG: glycosyltransferase family 4 protein [Phycisphaeraceae bacterium]|nr:glycosyltransferase family 4 protein [Phycisphaeraceae bacterium]
MRIALIIEHLDPSGGGAERNCVELAGRLAQRGHEVTVLCGVCTRHAAEKMPGVTLEEGPTGKPRTAVRLWRFANWIDNRMDEGDFDVSLSFHTSVAADVLQPLGGSMRATQQRNLATRRGGGKCVKFLTNLVTPKQVMLRRLEKRSLAHPRFKRVAALSGYVCRQFQELGIPEQKIRLIPNAVSLTPPTDEQRSMWRQRIRLGFGIDDKTTAYLFSAFNPQLKGIDTLMRALPLLLNDGVRAVVMLTGRVGMPEQKLAEQLGVRGSVRFVGQTQNMPAAFAAADVTVHPTFYDPSSRVVIESLLMGVPAITTQFDGSSDFVRRGEQMCGRVIEQSSDATALAAAMKELADPAERAHCRAAMNGLATELSIERHADQVETLLKEVAAA